MLGFALLLPVTITALAMPESVMKHPALPNISLHDMSGHLVKLKSLEGKIMVVTVWANWCPYCHQEAPGFVRLHKEMGSRVRFIGIAIDDRESAEHFVSQEHVSYPTLLAGAHPGLEILEPKKETTYAPQEDYLRKDSVISGRC
ncbi:TlpA disulfide reductase family protein [Acidithiobacillus ferriphilus]|nr:TlpA disulfide reductase family protein [Acidithiobacillus ferriphilus]